jgi:hypothetical protein
LPSSGDRRRLDRLIGEVKTVDHAAYFTRRSADCRGIGASAGGSLPGPTSVFSDSDPWGWLERLAATLLAAAYPELPVNTADIGAPVHSEDAASIFSGTFSRSDASAEVLRRLGPPLGLSLSSDPDRLDSTNCRVFDLLRRKLQDLRQPADYPETHHYLAHEIGLTESLGTLFVLLFVYWATPQLEVRLNGLHELTLADGRRLLAARLTSDIVPSLTWNDQLVESFATMGPVSSPQWQDSLHHLAAICPEIRDGSAGEDQSVLEPLLLSAVQSMEHRVQCSLDLLETFRDGPGAANEGSSSSQEQTQTEALFGSLSRLSHVSSDGFEPIYLAIRSTYSDFSLFERDLEDLARISGLSGQIEEIRMAQIFMAGARVPPSRFPVLAVDQEAAASPASLVRSRGRGWPSVAIESESFKARYSAVYANHHQWFYQVLPAYRTDIEAAHRKLRAVQLFDTLPELGPPSGAGLVEELSRLPDGPPRFNFCHMPFVELEAAESPRCPECGLSLEDTLPVGELARLMPSIEGALSANTRSLSGQLVGNVLQGGAGSQFAEFLKIVQASELTALSNTLDPELLAFIRSVLD